MLCTQAGAFQIRLIDDCTINGLNGTVGLRERFELRAVDKLAAMIVTVLGSARPAPTISKLFQSSTGFAPLIGSACALRLTSLANLLCWG